MLLAPSLPHTLRALRRTVGTLFLALAAGLLPAGAALAEKGLPKPHVSPALDAVLLPITAEVRKEFKLGKKAAGLVVVSVDPGGVAELYGFEPGEVITELDDKTIRRPVDLDSMIRYKLNAGTNYFFFEGTWKNKKKKTIIELTNEDYVKPVAIEDVSKWRAYNTGGSKSKTKRGNGYRGDDGYYYTGGGFYYYDFCDSYYDDFYQVYDYTLIYVEEIIITEVYITSIESSETYFYYDEYAAGYDWPDDEYYIEEVDAYYSSEEFYAEYESTEVYYEDEAYDPETGLSYEEAEAYGYLDAEAEAYDEGTVDDGYVDDGYVDDGYVDDGYVDDGYVDEGTVDDGYVDDGYVDDGYVDDGYVDDGYVDDGYVDDGYVDEGYVDEGYVDDGYVDEGYVDEGYVDEGYVDEGYVDEGYVDEGSGYEDTGGGECYLDADGYEVCE